MFVTTLRRREIYAMSRRFIVTTGRIGAVVRLTLVPVAGAILLAAAPDHWLRIVALLAVPLAGAAAAWLHAYDDRMYELREASVPVLSRVAGHLLRVGGTPVPSLAGVLEVAGALCLLTLVAGPFALPLAPWAALASGAVVLGFWWSVGRGVMLDAAWYNQDAPAAGPVRLFRQVLPAIAAGLVFAAYLSTVEPMLAGPGGLLTVAVVAALVPLTLYPLTVNYELALQASDEAVRYRINLLRREGARDVHSLVKNPLHLLRSELESAPAAVGFYVHHYLDEVRMGVEEAIRAVEEGPDPSDVELDDLVRYLDQMLAGQHRNIVRIGGATNVSTVGGRDYGTVRATVLDFVTNAVKAGAHNVEVEVQRLPTTPPRMRVSVRDDAPGKIYLAANPNGRSSLTALHELLRDLGAGEVRLEENVGTSKLIFAEWTSREGSHR